MKLLSTHTLFTSTHRQTDAHTVIFVFDVKLNAWKILENSHDFKEGINIVLSATGNATPADFWKNIQKAISRGLSAEEALRADGVNRIIMHTKVHLDNSKLFEYLGYKHTDKLYTKILSMEQS